MRRISKNLVVCLVAGHELYPSRNPIGITRDRRTLYALISISHLAIYVKRAVAVVVIREVRGSMAQG